MRIIRRPKISENAPKSGCVTVAAKRNAVPLQNASLLLPPSSAVMAGNAAAIMTASRAETKAVKFNVMNATQNRTDFPEKMLFCTGDAKGGCARVSCPLSTAALAKSQVAMMIQSRMVSDPGA